MFSLRVKQITKFDVQADNSTVLDVAVEILNESGEVAEERRLNFPLDTNQEQLQDELKNFLSTYNSDKENEAKNAEADAAHKQADEVIAAVTGLEFKEDGTTEQVADTATQEEAAPADRDQGVVSESETATEEATDTTTEETTTEENQTTEVTPADEAQPEQPAQ